MIPTQRVENTQPGALPTAVKHITAEFLPTKSAWSLLQLDTWRIKELAKCKVEDHLPEFGYDLSINYKCTQKYNIVSLCTLSQRMEHFHWTYSMLFLMSKQFPFCKSENFNISLTMLKQREGRNTVTLKKYRYLFWDVKAKVL